MKKNKVLLFRIAIGIFRRLMRMGSVYWKTPFGCQILAEKLTAPTVSTAKLSKLTKFPKKRPLSPIATNRSS